MCPKPVKGFNIKGTPFIMSISENSLELGIVVLVMFNKMFVIVLLSTFTLDMGWDPKIPVFQFVPIYSTQCSKWAKC